MDGWHHANGRQQSWDSSYGQGHKQAQPQRRDVAWPFERGNPGSAETDQEYGHIRQQQQRYEQQRKAAKHDSWPFERGSAGAADTEYEQSHQRQEQSQFIDRKRKDARQTDRGDSWGGGDESWSARDDSWSAGYGGSSRDYGSGYDNQSGNSYGNHGWSANGSYDGGNSGASYNGNDEHGGRGYGAANGYGVANGRSRGDDSDRRAGRSRSRDNSSRKYSGASASGGYKGNDAGRDGRREEDTSNDWYCDKCDARNFARRSDCFKCGARKPSNTSAGGVADGGRNGASAARGNDGKTSYGGCGKGGGGNRGGGGVQAKKDDGGGSRDLLPELFQGGRSRSRSDSSGSSSQDKQSKKRASRGPGLWDSTNKVKEASRPPPPASIKKRKPMELGVGARVDIFGLVGAAQYNGCSGRILEGPNEKGRWSVQVDYQLEAKTLALLPDNLRAKPSCGWEIVVAGLSNLVVERDLEEAFSQFGKVITCKVTRDVNGESKLVALLEMGTKEVAEKALEFANEPENFKIRARPVSVQWSTMVKQEMGLLKTRGEGNLEDEDVPHRPRRNFQENEESSASKNEVGTSASSGGGEQPKKPTIPTEEDLAKMSAKELRQLLVAHQVDVRSCIEKKDFFELARNTFGPKVEKLITTSDSATTAMPSAPIGEGSPANEAKVQSPVNGASNSSVAGEEAGTACGAPTREGRRRRKSAWGENDGGSVYIGATEGASARAAAPSDQTKGPVVPSEDELAKMSVKELRQLLAAHHVDVTGCIEKADFLEHARKLASR